jgi:UDP-N-acetylglucosamine 2-epimerase (non-hydrolysing)
LTIVIVAGTRPEIVKVSPLITALGKVEDVRFVLTGQHNDYEMSRRFVEELKLPDPFLSFELERTTPASQIGEIMTKLEDSLSTMEVELLVVQGDTNAMLASALSGVKLQIPVAHVEAGLRSYDWRMPEEHNRRMVDHISNLLFAPTERSKRNLVEEHVFGEVFVTGNTVIDAVNRHMPLAQSVSHIMKDVKSTEFALATIHRAENVDSMEVMEGLVSALLDSPIPVVFPVHPRTANRLRQSGLYERLAGSSRVQLLPPVGYFDMLLLMRNCRFIMTDSGGIQEEATAASVRKTVLVLRRSTERPEAVEAGFAHLVGLKKETILEAAKQLLMHPPVLPSFSPFGQGKAAQEIASIIVSKRRNAFEAQSGAS